MSDQSKIQTLGPADENAGVRAKVYAGISAVLGIVGLLATFNVVTADQALSIRDFAESAMNLAGSFGLGFAAFKTRKQTKNGTFDPAPELDPAEAAITAIQQTADRAAGSLNDYDRVRQAATDILGTAVSVGAAVIPGPVGDLIQAITDRDPSR